MFSFSLALNHLKHIPWRVLKPDLCMEGTFVDLGTWRKSENKIAWYGYRSKYSKIYGPDTQRRRVMKRKGLDFGILCCHRTGSSRLFSRTQATMDEEIFAISFVLISYFFHFYFCNMRVVNPNPAGKRAASNGLHGTSSAETTPTIENHMDITYFSCDCATWKLLSAWWPLLGAKCGQFEKTQSFDM